MGTPQFSVPSLELLAKSSYKISQIYTQPPRKSNRGHKLNPSPIQKSAENLNLAVRSPSNLNTDEELKFFQGLNPDIVVVVAYGQLIPKKYLEVPKRGFINTHASLLPKWRGAAPIQRAIINLDNETGISLMKITEELDSGPVMKKIRIGISPTDTSEEVSKKLSKIGSENIVKALNDIFENKAKFIEQKHGLATYAKKIKKSESKIDWNKSAKNIIGVTNGLNPNPGAWFKLNGYRIKVIKAEEVKVKGTPGEILSKDFTIACSENAVQIIELKKEGKKSMKSEEFLKGNKLEIGINLIENE